MRTFLVLSFETPKGRGSVDDDFVTQGQIKNGIEKWAWHDL